MRTAERRAVEESKTPTVLIEEALRLYLEPACAARTPFKLRLLTRTGRRRPGVSLADRAALYDLMGDRDFARFLGFRTRRL